MMKKITRIAALLATTALLFGAIGCSNDDDGGNSGNGGEKTDTVSPTSFELTSGADAESKTFTLTLGTTQINEAGVAALKADNDLTEQIANIVSPSSDITVSKIVVAKDATATELALSLTMASEAEAGTKGTLTLTLPADFTENSNAIEKTLSYEIKGSTPIAPDTDTPATAKTYDFVGLSASDFLDANGNAVSAWGNKASWTASATVNLPGGTTTVKDATVFCKVQTDASKQSLIRARTDDGSKTTGLNYNGGANSDISNGIAIADLDRYISIPVDGAGTISAEVTFKGAKETDSTSGGPFQVAFVDADGNLLGSVVTDDVKASSVKTVSGAVSAAGTVYLAFSRNGAKKGTSGTGGVDVSKITVAPKN